MSKKMTIRQVVDLLEKRGSPVNASALRFWETEKYLSPERTEGKHRVYPLAEVEKAYLLALISTMKRKLPNSSLPYRDEWETLCTTVTEFLKSNDASIDEIKNYQNLLEYMLDRMELESSTIQPLTIEKTQLPEDEIVTVGAAIMPSEHYFSGTEATLVRSIEWEWQQNPEVVSHLPSLSHQAWAEAKLQLQHLPPTGIAGQLRDRYLSLIKVELQPAMDELDMPGRIRLMSHGLFAEHSGLVALREIHNVFSLLKTEELVQLLLTDPQTRDGLLVHLARRLEQITGMEWGSHYTEWSSRNQMPSAQGYVSYLRKQYEFLDGKLSDEAKAKVRLHHITSYIGGIERDLTKDTKRQEVSVKVME